MISTRKLIWLTVLVVLTFGLIGTYIAQLWLVATGLLPLTPFAVAGFAYEDYPKGPKHVRHGV